MTLLLTHDDVHASVTMADAIEAMESGFSEQGEGGVIQPQRHNLKAGKGWLRIGPAVMEKSGYMGFKAMNLAPGLGLRYQLHLYRIADGDLLAMMDAQHLTTLRTGATSAVATRRLARAGKTVVGVIGAGAEAKAQADAMLALGVVTEMRIFSRTAENRERLAAELAKEWKTPVRAVDSGRAAVDGAGIIVSAVKSTETVLHGEWLVPGQHVNSVGTARPDQREIDPAVFQRSAIVVVDTREGVFGEAGDALAAKEVISAEQAHELSDVVAGRAPSRTSDDQITLFKSVGTAVQDLALGVRIFENAQKKGLGQKLAGFPILKKS